MSDLSNTAQIAAQLYALTYEITQWIKFNDPTVNYVRYQVPIVYDGKTCQLHVTRDLNDNISLEMVPAIKLMALFDLQNKEPVPARYFWVLLEVPVLNDGIPGVKELSPPGKSFPLEAVNGFLKALKKETMKFHQ